MVPSPSEFDKLPWKSNSKGRWWVFSDKAPEFRDQLSKAEGKTILAGGYRYKLSGVENRFINQWVHTP